jgi:hypothetical protein
MSDASQSQSSKSLTTSPIVMTAIRSQLSLYYKPLPRPGKLAMFESLQADQDQSTPWNVMSQSQGAISSFTTRGL